MDDAALKSFAESHGVTLDTLVGIFKDVPKELMSLLNMTPEHHQEYKVKFNEFDHAVNLPSDKKYNGAKGRALEDLATYLLSHSGLFYIYRNIRNSTNEIDLLVKRKTYGDMIDKSNLFGNKFLCECKNYNTKVSVTYTGKFYSVLNVVNAHFGIVFSNKGLTGSGWNESIGLCKKIFLHNGIRIIDINYADFKNINDHNTSIYEIIKDKIVDLESDTDVSSLLSTFHDSLIDDISSGKIVLQ